MSEDSEEKSSFETPLKSLYNTSVFLMLAFMVVLSIIGSKFSLSVLKHIAEEIQFLVFTFGSSYSFLMAFSNNGKSSKIEFSPSNLLLLISIFLTYYSVLHFFGEFSTFDALFNRGILILITCLFSVRYVLFRICSIFLKWMKVKESDVLITFHATLLSYSFFSLIYYFFICFSSISFIEISIFIIILISAFYDFVKISYLSPSIERVGREKSRNIFSEIINADLFAWTIVIIMFYLYYYNIFNISSCQTLYSFYSSIAQMFAAIVGIVAAFSIFILQQYADENEIKKSNLKNGITGFLIIYIFIIIVSVIGILISNDTTPLNMSLLQSDTDIALTRDLINPITFEFTLLMFPIALLYLYAMIVAFLNFDDISESVYEMY